MSAYDVILLHPPAVMDFRRRPIFPGALGSSVEQVQFNKVPVGMLSIAEYLERHGYRVVVDNICDRMVLSKDFSPEDHLAAVEARIFAIGLNFQQHTQGAIELAKLCKKLHPGSLVVLGGLTASRFHDEIIAKYPFIDGVIRGEGEKALLQLTDALVKENSFGATPNLTSRTAAGELQVNPLLPANDTLDDFEFTRLDLLQPKDSVYPKNSMARWSLALCRGCLHNCTICGGSAYSYKRHMGMGKPAFRSPEKIVADIRKLADQGVRFIGLYQDPRMGGRPYWRKLLELLTEGCRDIERLSIDLLGPADEEFIRLVAKIGKQVVIHICPDTGSDKVRKKLGRLYDNAELLRTVELCHKHGIPVTSFFSIGLAGEGEDEVRETRELWQQLVAMDQRSMVSGAVNVPLGGPILGPIVIDPGSPAFDSPEKYGYKLLYPDLEQYLAALSLPSWHQWLNYTTETLDNAALVELILATNLFAIEQRVAAGLYDNYLELAERLKIVLDREVVAQINQIMELADPVEKEAAFKALKAKHEYFLNRPLDSFVTG